MEPRPRQQGGPQVGDAQPGRGAGGDGAEGGALQGGCGGSDRANIQKRGSRGRHAGQPSRGAQGVDDVAKNDGEDGHGGAWGRRVEVGGRWWWCLVVATSGHG